MSTDLIGDTARELIGQELALKSGQVRKDEFQRWAVSVGDHNPVYFNPQYARSMGYRDVIMPPLFLQDFVHPNIPLNELKPDGIPFGGEVYSQVPVPSCPLTVAAGVDIVWVEPVYDGDFITARSVLRDLVQKNGRSGEFVIMTWVTTYTRRDGQMVAIETRSIIMRPSPEIAS